MKTSYQTNPNRVKNLNMNCSKEEGLEIVEKFGEQAYEKFRKLEFQYPEISDQKCDNEFRNLMKNPGSNQTRSHSPLIKKFHKSLWQASKSGHMSPIDYWKFLQKDFEAFKNFYYNRLTRSDWFKIDDRKDTWMRKGRVPPRIYHCGLTTSGVAPCVSYFKPKTAKYLIEKYLGEFTTIFDPFSGFSGRLLGALASNKNYVGQDINDLAVKESNNIICFIQNDMQNDAFVFEKDILEDNNDLLSQLNNSCLFTCPPYAEKEHYSNETIYKTCDEWIDECLSRYTCKTYLFVVDGTISKYKDKVVESLSNASHWGVNSEHVVKIDR